MKIAMTFILTLYVVTCMLAQDENIGANAITLPYYYETVEIHPGEYIYVGEYKIEAKQVQRPKSITRLWFTGGMVAFDFKESNPWGQQYQGGFHIENSNLMFVGSLLRINYQEDQIIGGIEQRVKSNFTGVEFQIGQRLFDRMGILFGFRYMQPNDEADGNFGIVMGPWFNIREFGDRLQLIAHGGVAMMDELVSWNARIGVSYRIDPNVK